MEKLVYVLWRRPEASVEDFAATLRGDVARRLVALGARGLSLNLVDAAAEAASRARLTHMEPPLQGLASFWLPCADERSPFEGALATASGRLAGYAVAESTPLLPELVPGERAPGIDMVALLERPEHLAPAEWLHRWLDLHRDVALETQATFLYVRNVVVRALTEGAPPLAGIVEEGFPAEAVTDPARWYRAEDDPEALRRNLGRMIESCKRFLDLGRVESHPTSLYPIQERP